jgi:hypothetical protein
MVALSCISAFVLAGLQGLYTMQCTWTQVPLRGVCDISLLPLLPLRIRSWELTIQEAESDTEME